MKKLGIYLVLALIAFALWMAYLLFIRGVEDPSLQGSGTIETTEIKVGSKVGGRVLTVEQEEGATVGNGAVLMTFDPYQLPEQREQLAAQLMQASAQLSKLQNGAQPEEIAAANARAWEAQAGYQLATEGPRKEDVERVTAMRRQAEADRDLANDNFERMKKLFDSRVISQQEFDTTRTAYQAANERFNAAREQELALRNGSRPQEINAARARVIQQQQQAQLIRKGPRFEDIASQAAMVSALQAQVGQLDKAIQELQVFSPCNCEIAGLNIKAGQLVLPNQTVATLINVDDLWVRIYIPEEDFGKISLGDEAIGVVDAFPDKVFHGTVVQLGSRAEFTPRNVQTKKSRKKQVFGVKVALKNKDRLLRPGMNMDVTLKPKTAK
jgi:HlyD family secretion protein